MKITNELKLKDLGVSKEDIARLNSDSEAEELIDYYQAKLKQQVKSNEAPKKIKVNEQVPPSNQTKRKNNEQVSSSFTKDELNNPHIIDSSRLRRINKHSRIILMDGGIF